MKRETLNDYDQRESAADRLRRRHVGTLNNGQVLQGEVSGPQQVPAPRDARGYFLPGHSGNPSGRRKQNQRIVELAREYTETALMTLVEIATNPKATSFARIAAAREILDRGWGRAPEMIALLGNNGDGNGPQIVLHVGGPDVDL